MKTKFFIPTINIVEQVGLKNIADCLPNYSKNILLVTGRNSAKHFGFTNIIFDALNAANKNVFLFDNVESDPKLSTADAIAQRAIVNKCDTIIGLGGGSALDAAKAAAVAAANNLSVEVIINEKIKTNKKLFLIAVPTTAGTGSEATQYSLLSTKNTKLNLSTDNSFPDIALLDAKLTTTMPRDLTVNTGLDAFSHAVEGYFTLRSTPYTDLLAELAIQVIAVNLHDVINCPSDINKREKILLASNLAGRVIAHTGTSACHALGYFLTLKKGLPHGLANAVLLGKIAKNVENFNRNKIAKIENILNSSINDFIKSFDIDTSLDSYNLTDEELNQMCEIAATRSSSKFTPGQPDASTLKSWITN